MYIPRKRENTERKNIIFIISAVSIIFAVTLLVGSYFLARYLRQHYPEPKYLPGTFLQAKWKKWRPGNAAYGQVSQRNRTADTSYRGAGETPEMQTNEAPRRETSIRSIMTLPPYSSSPKPTEQIIAREGERGGMDMVVEYPETAEEQENRREEHMDSLYQLRLQRRQELADREARRRERREARDRGDYTRLEQLNAETRERASRRRAGTNSATNITTALTDHQARERDRRISSVSYAELGRVRHDGSRLRADSHNSENPDSDSRPLLQNDSSSSAPSFEPSSFNSRIQSVASSIMSESTGTEMDPLAPTSTRGSSRPVSHNEEGDLGALNIPPPPEYDHLDWGDAPAYQSPLSEHFGQQLPAINRLPSIHVNLPSPLPVSPTTPTQNQFPAIDEGHPTPRGNRVASGGSATTVTPNNT
ncbi:unnamed protein product [Penicillium salamii]|nr:unnamed protein product [Penicillium salamii]